MVEEAPMSAELRWHLSFPSHRDLVERDLPWGLILCDKIWTISYPNIRVHTSCTFSLSTPILLLCYTVEVPLSFADLHGTIELCCATSWPWPLCGCRAAPAAAAITQSRCPLDLCWLTSKDWTHGLLLKSPNFTTTSMSCHHSILEIQIFFEIEPFESTDEKIYYMYKRLCHQFSEIQIFFKIEHFDFGQNTCVRSIEMFECWVSQGWWLGSYSLSPQTWDSFSQKECRISFCRISIQSTIVPVRKSVWK